MDGLPSDWRVVEPPAPPNTPGSKPPVVQSNTVWGAVLVAGIAALVLAGAWMLAGPSGASVAVEAAAIDVVPPAASDGGLRQSVAPPESAAPLVVDVGGAVRRPGVYRLASGARVVDALEAAGGFGPSVDTVAAARDLNLAAPLRDGERVRVPARGEGPATAASEAGDGTSQTAAATPRDGLVDLNTASASELEALPAIGPATAAKIIAAREEQPFTSVDELLARKILGQSAMGKVRDLVTVR